MREIIFKAKRKDNGKWVEGLPIMMWGILHIQKFEDENTAYEIDPDTLCQYTGLTDKNGKKIWENDIIERTDLHSTKEPSIGFVEYDIENTSFLIHWTDIEIYSATFPWKDKIRVVGNIFDNPELLEVDS